MQLRHWQAEAVQAALHRFNAGHSHFLCLATPGAGKTLMASEVARRLLVEGKIDLVVCFSPSVNVATSFQAGLEAHLNRRLDGRLGSQGCSLTYQAMLNLDESFWSLFTRFKTLVIFDEIHHCAGDQSDNGNAWGQQIITRIQGRATYTLALTGTPWRSDKTPIALASYCHEGKVQCNYSYGLEEAILDGVCRTPRIVAIDNEAITVQTGHKHQHYASFKELLTDSRCSYQQLLDNDELLAYIIQLADKQLNRFRKTHPSAGALVVAASVEHARKLVTLIQQETGDTPQLVTYLQDDAQQTIRDFREASDKWIVSVGMISEGTDIPRLKVCCHLTRVKTELYFRQVLGRVLRTTGIDNDEGYLYMPAEPQLIEFAERVVENIPEANTVMIQTMNSRPVREGSQKPTGDTNTTGSGLEIRINPTSTDVTASLPLPESSSAPSSKLSEEYETTIGLFGRFRQAIIQLGAEDIVVNG